MQLPQQPDPLRVTALLKDAEAGDVAAVDALLPLVYEELRGLAQRAQGRMKHATLQPTMLVHDAYLRLVENPGQYRDREHFLIVASMAMRQMVTDYARARNSQKRGGAWQRISSAHLNAQDAQPEDLDLVDLDAALSKLQGLSRRQARIVELRFFTGLSVEEVAGVLKLSLTTVGNEWRQARAFLRRELERAGA